MSDIASSAVIKDGASIGDHVSIGHHSVISSKSTIENDVEIGPNVILEGDVQIGEETTVGPGTVIGTPPQDRGYDGEQTGVRIGNRNVIREYVTINRATTSPGGVTVIGNDNMLMSYCHIAHDCSIGNDIDLANGVTLAGHVEIEDEVMMGGLTPVHQFVRIGEHAMVGGLSRINKDVAPYIRVSGNPAQVYDLNSIGLRRSDIESDTRSLLKQAFKLIYRADNNTTQALEQIEQELPSEAHLDHLIEFIRQSERGVHK